MPAGFQVWSQDGSGVVQIDSIGGFPNFQLRSKTIQVMQPGPIPVYTVFGGNRYNSYGYLTTFNFYALSPLIAYEASDYAVPHQTVRNGNSFSVTFVSTGQATISLYVFDQNDFTVNNRFGGQVFNTAGQLVADLTTPFAKPVGFASGNVKYAIGSTGWASDGGLWGDFQGTFGFPVNQRVAVACVQPAFSIGGMNGAPNNTGVFLSAFQTSGGNVNVRMAPFGDNGNYNNYVGFREALGWSFMGIDVSYL